MDINSFREYLEIGGKKIPSGLRPLIKIVKYSRTPLNRSAWELNILVRIILFSFPNKPNFELTCEEKLK